MSDSVSIIGLDPSQFRQLVVRPTLKMINLWSDAAESLVLGTGMVESGLRYLDQLGNVPGGGLGVFQDEPADLDDLNKNFLAFRGALRNSVALLMTAQDPQSQLQTNLAYMVAVCRCHYYRVTAPLPDSQDAAGMAAYHKQFYNSLEGATDPTKSLALFKLAISTK